MNVASNPLPIAPSRRSFVSGAGAIAAVAPFARALPACAQVPSWRAVDVHHHLAPPKWIADVVEARKTG